MEGREGEDRKQEEGKTEVDGDEKVEYKQIRQAEGR